MSRFSGTSKASENMHSRLFFSLSRLDYATLIKESLFFIPKNMFLSLILSFLKIEALASRLFSIIAYPLMHEIKTLIIYSRLNSKLLTSLELSSFCMFVRG